MRRGEGGIYALNLMILSKATTPQLQERKRFYCPDKLSKSIF